jgi:hypothetical protein
VRGKHGRQFRGLSVAIRYGAILAVSGSIAAGVVLAAGHPRPTGILPLPRAEPSPAVARLRVTVAAGAAARTAAPAASRASGSAVASPSTHPTAAAGICTSPSAAGHALAARMSRGILTAVRGAPDVGLAVSDTHTGDRASREYVLQFMAQVIPAQRWGVPASAGPGVTVHVKNGWLPNPQLWVVNSIGAFTSDDGVYKIVVLSQGNPALSDGIALVQGIATVVNRTLVPG